MNHHIEVSVVIVSEMDLPPAIVDVKGVGDFDPAPLRAPMRLVGPYRGRSPEKGNILLNLFSQNLKVLVSLILRGEN